VIREQVRKGYVEKPVEEEKWRIKAFLDSKMRKRSRRSARKCVRGAEKRWKQGFKHARRGQKNAI